MIHSFLLIGQSNMAGRGDINEAIPVNIKRIKTLRNGRWQTMFRPINPDRSFSGVNLAESFAEAYANKYDVDVGLICCADGGTRLEQWIEGGVLYDHAVYQAKLAQRTSTIAGVLWHQGESDCGEALSQTYKPRLKEMFEALKRDLNLYDVPFLVGGLGDFLINCERFPYLKNYTAINEQLKEAAREMPMTCFVPADGLTSKPDNLHFNAKSLYEFGLRYFEAFEKTRDPNKIFAEKIDNAVRSEMEKL